jgi:hypothetical protein
MVDEVLPVADFAFRKKFLARMEQVATEPGVLRAT